MNTGAERRGVATRNTGSDSVSSALVHVGSETGKQKWLDGSGASFTRSGCRKTSRVWSDGRQYWVYAHRATDGAVLYVGCTADRKGRESRHRARSAWYPQVARTDYLGPFDRTDGLRIERRLIEKHDPPHNFMHTSRYVHWRSQKAAS